ncbi:hypothetical protein [Succinimonas amylolytica]|uniref:hypothetical protein n=1 Tax=Succinimonas amylolytica TaxID=83769 RepID=UPI00037EC19A|nr:hypothetical protein [Succinimonas amylolytica]
MKYFIDNLEGPRRISPRAAFASPFQALAMMLNIPGMFTISILAGMLCLLSAAIPFLAFFIVPMSLSLVMAKTVSAICDSESDWKELNNWVYSKLKLRVWIFALMSLLPLIAIFGSIINLMQNTGAPNTGNAAAIYYIIIAIMFSGVWGLALFSANFLAHRENNGISVSCLQAISLLKENVVPVIIMLMNWFMELALIYCLLASAVITAPMLFGNTSPLAINIFTWGFLFIVMTFFLSHYLITLSILGYQIFAPAEKEDDSVPQE